ncbi:MAG TPA: Trm112 family protein [Candidatus Dormibacteraeota bacterium]
MISQDLLEILACPKCHTKVELKGDRLRCPHCKVLYPIVDGIPVMLIEEGKPESGETERSESA